MQLNQMRYFVAVVESGGFRAAAERLFVSQSAVSQQIRALERELGVRLIDRDHGRFEPTRAGERFHMRARTILDEIDELAGETRRIGAATGGWSTLSVWYLSGYAGLDVANAVAGFSEMYPKISIDAHAATHEQMRDALINGTADMALMEQRRAFSDNYENRVLAEAPTMVELPASSPLASRRTIPVSELTHLPCVLVSTRDQRTVEADYVRLVYGFAGPYRFAADLVQARMQVVASGGFLLIDQVGTMPPVFPGLVRLPLTRHGRPMTRRFCAFWLKDNLNPNMARFADLLERVMTDAGSDDTPSPRVPR